MRGEMAVRKRENDWKGLWLWLAAGVCLVLGLMCAESVGPRGFWTDFWTAVGTAFVVCALMQSAEAGAGKRAAARGKK